MMLKRLLVAAYDFSEALRHLLRFLFRREGVLPAKSLQWDPEMRDALILLRLDECDPDAVVGEVLHGNEYPLRKAWWRQLQARLSVVLKLQAAPAYTIYDDGRGRFISVRGKRTRLSRLALKVVAVPPANAPSPLTTAIVVIDESCDLTRCLPTGSVHRMRLSSEFIISVMLPSGEIISGQEAVAILHRTRDAR